MTSRAQVYEGFTDDEIVRRFQETHDNECFTELFMRHRKRVYLACRGFFADGGAAEDATQEAFLRAYQNMHRFSGGDFCGWLVRIAKNVCIDQWRKRRPEAGSEELEGTELPAGASFEQRFDLHFAVEKIRKEMEALSPEQRQCLDLKIEGYSYEETATRTGLPVEAVKSHLQNGRRMLWSKMEGMLSQLR
jgi:RNA polymerase sigma-70 factor (ECF subfamily)